MPALGLPGGASHSTHRLTEMTSDRERGFVSAPANGMHGAHSANALAAFVWLDSHEKWRQGAKALHLRVTGSAASKAWEKAPGT